MSKSIGERFVLLAIICFVGVGIVFLHAQIGDTKSERDGFAVRMAVDPTVLPLVPPPGAPAEDAEEVPPMGASDEVPDEVGGMGGLEASAAEAVPEVEVKSAEAAPKSQVTEEKTDNSSAPLVAGKGAVTGLGLDTSDSGFTLTVNCDRPVGDTSYMNLDGPKRLVIDLRQPWTLKAKNVLRSANGPVKHIVVGAHPDKLRFVVHFRSAPKGKLTPRFERSGNRLIVSVDLP